MLYINAVELIECCLKHGVLQTDYGRIAVYRSAGTNSPEGWYLEDKETVVREVMNDTEGQKVLIEALAQKGIMFKPTDFSWLMH